MSVRQVVGSDSVRKYGRTKGLSLFRRTEYEGDFHCDTGPQGHDDVCEQHGKNQYYAHVSLIQFLFSLL